MIRSSSPQAAAKPLSSTRFLRESQPETKAQPSHLSNILPISTLSAGDPVKKFSSLAIAAILLLTTQRTAFGQAGYPSAYTNGGGYQNFNAYQNSGGNPYAGGYHYGGQPSPYGSYPHAAHRHSNAGYQRSIAMQQSIYEPTLTAMTMFQDGEVPVPPDAGAIPSPGTFQPSDPNVGIPNASGPIISSPDMTLPLYDDTTTWNAFAPPITSDPFVGQPGGDPYAPYSPYQQGIPPQGAYAYGANPANPYRFGWCSRLNASWLPNGGVEGAPAGVTDGMDIIGVDYDLTNTTPVAPGWILNWTNQFGWRNWSGPGGTLNLPSNVFRLGIDLELETPKSGPYSISLGVTPSINTDFDSGAFSEGFQLDARGILFMQLDQYWTLGLGAQYWDRVDSIVIPWAGLIYRDDYWEWQLMYPEARVSLFLGNESYWSKWLYVRAEYHVEAYGVNSTYAGVNSDNQIQLADKRLLLGLKMDAGMYSWIIEGGWVFDRDVEFDNTVPGFRLENGFIGQIGLRY